MTKDPNKIDHSQMEIISEMDIPFDVDPREITKQMVVASKFFGGLSAVQKNLDVLKNQKQEVLNWFKEQEENLQKQDDFLRSKIEEALYAAEQAGESKPKLKTWAGTAFFTTRNKTDWMGKDNKSQELVKFAKEHDLEVEVIEKVNLKDVKRELMKLDPEERKEYVRIIRNKTLTIRTND